MAWYAALGVLGSLAAIFPWELGDKADPLLQHRPGFDRNGISWLRFTP